jgi:hypothetical protein
MGNPARQSSLYGVEYVFSGCPLSVKFLVVSQTPIAMVAVGGVFHFRGHFSAVCSPGFPDRNFPAATTQWQLLNLDSHFDSDFDVVGNLAVAAQSK